MIKDQIAIVIKEVLQQKGIPAEKCLLSTPAHSSFGDYSTNIALVLAKELKKNPLDLAEDIAKDIKQNEIIEKIEVVKPGFINIWIQKKYLLSVLNQCAQDKNFGKTDKNVDKKVIVEYSSPNIAKPFTIGHLRSTIIGDAIANLLEYTGYTVFRDNHVGDWGTQFGKLIYAIKTWGDMRTIEKSPRPVKNLVELYIHFHDEAEKNPEIENEGRKWFKKLEDGDTEARAIWKQCIEWSWKEFNSIYQQLNVTFTENEGRGYGESFFEDKMKIVLDELDQKLGSREQYKESNGAKLVFFPQDAYPPLMILKQDGSTLYSTRDLATDKFRLSKQEYGSDIMIINEVGIEQSLYFNQLFETEKMLGWVKEGQRVHVKHGLYRFKDMKMSTRKGNVIWLEDVLEEAKQRAFRLAPQQLPNRTVSQSYGDEDWISPKNSEQTKPSSLSNADYTTNAEIIGIGALKWNDLKRSSHLDIVFDWDEILNMDGNSGPYIQYTYVRCKSVLDKTTAEYLPVPQITEMNEEEIQILRLIVKFPEIIADAAHNLAPNQICTYLFELAQSYNLFYQKHHILKIEDEDTKKIRLAITAATACVMQNGLNLLGIRTVKRM